MYWITRRHLAGDHRALTERIGDTLVGLGRRMWPTATFGESDLAEITAPLVHERHAERLRTTKAYRLLKSIKETAVDDDLIRHHPCRTRGAGKEKAALIYQHSDDDRQQEPAAGPEPETVDPGDQRSGTNLACGD